MKLKYKGREVVLLGVLAPSKSLHARCPTIVEFAYTDTGEVGWTIAESFKNV